MQKTRYLAIKSKLDLVLRKRAEEEPEESSGLLGDDEHGATPLEAQSPSAVATEPTKDDLDLYETRVNSDGLGYFIHQDNPKMPSYDKTLIDGINGDYARGVLRFYFGNWETVPFNDKVVRTMLGSSAFESPGELLRTTSQWWSRASPLYKEAISNAIILSASQGRAENVFFDISRYALKELYGKHEVLFNDIIKELSEIDLNSALFSYNNQAPMGFVWDEMIKGKYEPLKEILREKLNFETIEFWMIKLSRMYRLYPDLVKSRLIGTSYFENYSSILDVAEVTPEAKSELLSPVIKLEGMFQTNFERFYKIYNKEERAQVYSSLLNKLGSSTAANFFHALQFTKEDILQRVMEDIPQDVLSELARRAGPYLVGLGDILPNINAAGGIISPEIEKGILDKYIRENGIKGFETKSSEYLLEKYEPDVETIKDNMFKNIYQLKRLEPDSTLGKLIGKALDEMILSETAQRDDHLVRVLQNIDSLSKFILSKDKAIASLTTYAGGYYDKVGGYSHEEQENIAIYGKASLLAALADTIKRVDDRQLSDEAIEGYLNLAEDLFSIGYSSESKIFKSRWNDRATVAIRPGATIMTEIEGVSLLAKAESLEGPLLKKYLDIFSKINSLSLFRNNKRGAPAHKSGEDYVDHIARLVGEKEWDKLVASEPDIKRKMLEGFSPSPSLIEEHPEYFEVALRSLNFQTLTIKDVVHVLLPKVFPEVLSGDLSSISYDAFSFINKKLLETLREKTIPYYISLFRSTKGFGRARTWFERDPGFLEKIITKSASYFPKAYLTGLAADDFNSSNAGYIELAVIGSSPVYLDILESKETLEPFASFISLKENGEILYYVLKNLIADDNYYLEEFAEFINKHNLVEPLKKDQATLNKVMQFAQDNRGEALNRRAKADPAIKDLLDASDTKYSAARLREIRDIKEAKRVYPDLKNDIEVEGLPINIRVTDSIFQDEQRSDHLSGYFGRRYTVSNNNTDPTQIMYDVGKDLVHAVAGVDHTNVGASGFTNSWALVSVGDLDPKDMVSADKALLEGDEEAADRPSYHDDDYIEPKDIDSYVEDAEKAIVIEQYQSDYPPLYSRIFNEEDEDYDPRAKERLVSEYGEDSFKDFAKHLDYINKAYPYLAIINTVEVAKKIGAPFIYIHDFRHVVDSANIKNKDKARKLYSEIPSLITKERVQFYDGDLFWKIPADDSVVKKMREEIRKNTGKGPEYDFSKSPRQNAEAVMAVRERARRDLRTRWNSAGENKSKLDELKRNLQIQLETDMKEFDPEELAGLATPTEVLIYLGKVKRQYGKGEFKKKFGLINRDLGILSRAFESIYRMVKLSSMLMLSKNDRALGVHNLWRKVRYK